MKKYISIVMVLVSLSACYGDKGNYDYTELNDLTIEGMNGSYDCFRGDKLTIEPTVKAKNGNFNPADYTYQWIIEYVSNEEFKTVSTTKNLEELDLTGFATRTYRCIYKITDKATNVEYAKRFTLVVNMPSVPNAGLVVMNNVDGKMRLDMVSMINDVYSPYRDVLSLALSTFPEQTDPKAVIVYDDNTSPQRKTMLLSSASGVKKVHYTDYSYTPDYTFQNVGIGFPGNFVVDKFIGGRSISNNTASIVYVISNEGNIYTYHGLAGTLLMYYAPSNRYKDAENPFSIAPFVGVTSQNAVLFDNDTKSIVKSAGNARYSVRYAEAGIPEFKLNNSGKDMVYMSNKNTTNVFVVLKDPATLDMYIGSIVASNGTKSSYAKINKAQAPEIDNATMWSLPTTSTSNFIFYATPTKVYAYNLLSEKATLLKEYSSGWSITNFRMLGSGMTPALNTHLSIATYNESAKNGRIEIFTYNDAGTQLTLTTYQTPESETKAMSWEGFGKIVDWTYKVQ